MRAASTCFRSLFALLIIGMLALGGCGIAQTPTVSLDRVALEKGDAQRIAATFDFTITNPNPIELDIARSSYTLSVNGNRVASSGEANIPLHLAAVGTSPLSLPIELRYEDVVAGAIGLALGGGPSYEIELVLGFDSKLGPIDVSVTQTGTMPLAGL